MSASKIASSYKKYSTNCGKEFIVVLIKVNGYDYTRTQKTHSFKDKEELKGFLEAYVKDLKSISLEKYTAYKVDVMHISIEGMFYASINPKYYPNTIQYLKDLQMNLLEDNPS